MTTGQAIITDQDSKLVETYEGQYVALVLLLIFHLGFEPVSRFSTKLGHVNRQAVEMTPTDSTRSIFFAGGTSIYLDRYRAY